MGKLKLFSGPGRGCYNRYCFLAFLAVFFHLVSENPSPMLFPQNDISMFNPKIWNPYSLVYPAIPFIQVYDEVSKNYATVYQPRHLPHDVPPNAQVNSKQLTLKYPPKAST